MCTLSNWKIIMLIVLQALSWYVVCQLIGDLISVLIMYRDHKAH